jgi:hypothetical protein
MRRPACRGCLPALQAFFLACFALAAQAAEPIGPQTDDSPGGMTCHYFLAAANMTWQRKGGDWHDVDGAVHGSQSFASANVSRQKSPQVVEWDATSVMQSWDQAGAWAGAIYLRLDAAGRAGSVEFASRENADATQRPSLRLTWSDGQTTELAPAADTYFACPNYRSYGAAPQLKVASDEGAMLLFAMPSRPGMKVTRARLVMTSARQIGAGGTVGLYAGRRPGGAAAAVEFGLAANYPRDIGLERHSDVWVVDRFEAAGRVPAWLNKSDTERLERVVSAADAGQRFEALDGAAAAITLHTGTTQALNSHIKLDRRPHGEPEEAYFRYYLRLGDNWNPTLDGGKLPGLSGTYGRAGWGGRKADGSNGWSARGSFLQQTAGGTTLAGMRAVGSYVYHAGMDTNYGDNWGWNLGPTGLLQKNRWYCIEQHVRLNTPGQTNGVLEIWVDGRLAFQKTDIRYRDTSTLRIESVWMNVYHGGARPAPHDMTLFIDNLVVAGRYIGPMSVTGKH